MQCTERDAPPTESVPVTSQSRSPPVSAAGSVLAGRGDHQIEAVAGQSPAAAVDQQPDRFGPGGAAGPVRRREHDRRLAGVDRRAPDLTLEIAEGDDPQR